ncbi:MAG: hypothetical protein H6741_10890 [Alphaproteobacteria bacterium]|nr:hypothetical protein [Alphaproteobacteria bacterium]MCB9793222.1 hypothetical protein [Alphaproteobacteria bacterium]
MPEGLGALKEAVDALDPALRERLAQRWATAALDEHASIASFSRFSLHLQAVGAPPELLVGAHKAALDELEHARLCFTLASVYAGEPLSPAPLDLSGDLLGPLTLPAITAAAVLEGCVGETVAALEAATAAQGAEARAVREALQTIAGDEARHAQLAWRFVQWALAEGDPEVEAAARQAFQHALGADPGPEPAPGPEDAALAAHGKLSEAARYRVRREAAQAVLPPAIRALFKD